MKPPASPDRSRLGAAAEFGDVLQRASSGAAEARAVASLARAAIEQQREEAALAVVCAAAARIGDDPALWQWSGLLHRALDDRAAAIDAFGAAARLAPGNAGIAHGRARVTLEAGLPATTLYEAARRLAPGDSAILLGMAAAELAEERGDEAIARLAVILNHHPDWVQGHDELARLRWMMGDRANFTQSYIRALASASRQPALWQGLLNTLLLAERHDAVRQAAAQARTAIGSAAFVDAADAAAASEAGDKDAADALFARLDHIDDAALDVRRVRHLLRTGRVEAAAPLIERRLKRDGAGLMWPYAAVAWRLSGDPRWEWLEGPEHLVSVIDLAPKLPPLDRLAGLLRGLHVARDQHLDQSVRGGTQTDGMLLARIEPEIAALRQAIIGAVEAHIAQLPLHDPAHPALAPARGRRPRFAGSWSVRLAGAGHHANHVHTMGWISSALYVALPESADSAARAGWLTLGEPQAELGLDLRPVRAIEPKPGRLVLFPSTMWHGTIPFAEGERLTVAFDIAHPAA